MPNSDISIISLYDYPNHALNKEQLDLIGMMNNTDQI